MAARMALRSAPSNIGGPGGGGALAFGTALYNWLDTYFGSPWVHGHLPASSGSVVAVSTVSGWQSAINAATSGTIIEVASGTYDFNSPSFLSITNKAWSPSNPVTIRPANGATVIISNSGTTAVKRGFYIVSTTGLRILGRNGTGTLLFDGQAAGGTPNNAIKWDGNCTDIEVNGVDATRWKGPGFLLDSYYGGNQRVAFWNCKSYNNSDHGYYLGSWGGNTGAPPAYGVSGLLVANCAAYDNYAFDAGAGEGYGFQIGDSVVHGRIVNCTADNNGANSGREGGFVLFTQGTVPAGTDNCTDVEFINCVSTNNVVYGYDAAGTAPNKTTNHVTSCLSFGNGTGDFNAGNMWTLVSPNVTGSDPLYVSRAAKDFRVSTTGAAHAAGDADWMPDTDFDGNPRVTADLGCYAAV